MELADLLSANLRAVELEPQTFLEGKLLVSKSKRRQVEIRDILTWTEAFTIFQMVICTSLPHRWMDMTKYKLLIIQTARQYPGLAWLEYDLAFRKDAAASGLCDWSKMNLDLYNFHLRSPTSPQSLPSFCLARLPPPRAAETWVCLHRFAAPGMTVNVAGHLADVSFDTGAATAKGSMLQFTALSPTPPDFDLALPPRVGKGDVFDGRVAPSDDSVHSVNNLAALPRQQKELPCVAKLLCSVPVQPYSSVNSFSPLAPVSKVSPLQLDQFQLELRYHPDRYAVNYVISGIREGFRIGFVASSVSLKSALSNMRSSIEHPSVIDAYLQTEVSARRVAGPFPSLPFSSLHISRFGVIPKNNQPEKWRLILDLSSPEGHSVNDGIPKPPFTVQYVSVDAFIEGIMVLGRGTLMAKFDVASAYRNVAIHPDDRPLLGMMWRGQYFVDMVLPFGLRSAPFIFTAIADLVEWILVHNYSVNFLRHYLDDFLTLGPPASPVCYNNLQTCVQLCKSLGLPLHPDKLEGPATCLTILGIELDSEKLQARLPTDKRDRIKALLDEWSLKRFCKRRELESLIGHLHHACKVAPQGRTFLRRMIN